MPGDTKIDTSGAIYISDPNNHVILKNAGTFAGQSGKPGRLDATGTLALFDGPLGIGAVGLLHDARGPAQDAPVWEPRIDQLGTQYPTAVLAIVGADGFPFAGRVPVSADRAAGLIRIGAIPNGMPAAPGRACLTAHMHSPEFEWQRNFQVRGELVETDDGWALAPRKLVGGFEVPETQLAMLRENFKKVMRYRKTARAELAKRKGA